MNDKFKGIPVDDDTKILVEFEASLGEYEILYQKWAWEGVIAESYIFSSEDLLNLKDAELEKMVRESPLLNVGSKLTISRTESGFTFVNFNFQGGD